MRTTVLPPLALLLLMGAFAAADDKKPDDKPAKLPLGRDTTYVVGPLDKQGYIDYEAALNAELGRGVTRETNANAGLWMAFGPTPEGGEMPPAFYRWLDMPAPPRGGEYFVGLGKYAQDHLALTNDQLGALFEQQGKVTSRPWAARDFAAIAEWLKANERPMAVAEAALKLPHYFNPLVTKRKEGEPGSLIGALLPSVQKCRELASALSARAMLRVHEGKFDAAWQDLLACHRLGRLTSHGGTLIESLVGIAICQIASNATVAYLEHADLTGVQAVARLKDLRALPAFAPMADKIDTMERFTGLEVIQNIRRGHVKRFDDDFLRLDLGDDDVKALDKIDWVAAMRAMNASYDRISAAMRLKDRAKREKEFEKIEGDFREASKALGKPGDLAKLASGKGSAQDVGTAVGNVFMKLLAPAVQKVQYAHDRAEQVERNLHVAFALAAYRADNGKYPARLDGLTPKYLPAVPGDLFSGKALVYRPNEKGYLVYSLGQNGKDDEGRWLDDTPPGDDLRVRLPQPEVKK